MRVEKKGNSYSFHLKANINGKIKKITQSGFKNELEAYIALNKAVEDIENGTYYKGKYKPKQLTIKSTSFENVTNQYLKSKKKKLKNSSYSVVKTRIDNLLNDLKGYDIQEINTPLFLEKYINNCTDYKVKELNSILDYAVTILEVIKDNNLKKFNLSKLAKQKKAQKKQKTLLFSKNDLTIIFHTNKVIFNIACKLLYYSGIRKGELLALNLEDFTEHNNQLYLNINKSEYRGEITTPKTINATREIAIPNFLKNDLEELKKQKSNKKLFTISDLTPPAVVTKNVKEFRLHKFRHTHTSELVSNSIPISEIQRRLGHSNILTTLKIYTHFVENNTSYELINKLEEL